MFAWRARNINRAKEMGERICLSRWETVGSQRNLGCVKGGREKGAEEGERACAHVLQGTAESHPPVRLSAGTACSIGVGK